MSILLLSISKIYLLPFHLSSHPQLPSIATMASNPEHPRHDATARHEDVTTVEPRVLLQPKAEEPEDLVESIEPVVIVPLNEY